MSTGVGTAAADLLRRLGHPIGIAAAPLIGAGDYSTRWAAATSAVIGE